MAAYCWPGEGRMGFRQATVVAVLFIVIATPPAAGALLSEPGAITGAALVSISVGQTIQFDQSNEGGRIWNASVNLTGTTSLTSASLSVSTPPFGSEALTQPSVLTEGHALWSWPETYGTLTGQQAGDSLSSNNSSSVASLEIPPGLVTHASVSLSTAHGTVRGNFSVNLSVGAKSLVQFRGADGYAPPVTFPWSADPAGIRCLSVGREPDGSYLIAIGELAGNLTLISEGPSIGGRVIYSTDLASTNPVTSVTVGALYLGGPLSVAATAAGDVFLLSPAPTSWFEHIFTIPTQGGAAPQLGSIQLLQYPNGLAAVAVADNLRGVFVSNETGLGPGASWTNPASRLIASLPGSPIILTSSANATSAILAVGQGAQITLLGLDGAASRVIGTLGLPGSDSVVAMSFNASGSALAIASTQDRIYVSIPLLGAASTPRMIFQGSSPIGSLSSFGDPTQDVLAFSSDLSGGSVILQPWTNPQVIPLKGTSSEGFVGIGFAGVFSSTGDDLILSTSSELLVAQAWLDFNSTTLDNWAQILQTAVNETAVTHTSQGATVVQVPMTLRSSNCSVHLLSAQISYNSTQTVPVPLTDILRSNGTSTLRLLVNGSSAGQIFVLLDLTYTEPPAPGSVPWLEFAIVKDLGSYGLLVGTAALGIGAAVLVLGSNSYRARAKHKAPPASGRTTETLQARSRITRHDRSREMGKRSSK